VAEAAWPRRLCSVTEIAEAELISKSYVSRILRLALLSPDIAEAIIGGWADRRVMLEKLERPLPVGWEEQRRDLLLSHQTAQWSGSSVAFFLGARNGSGRRT